MKNAFICRTYQAVLYVAEFFLPWREPKLITGAGSFAKLPQTIKQDGVDSVLIVTDQGLMRLGMLEPLTKALAEENVKFCIYDKVVPNPTTANVAEAENMYRQNDCNGIIAVGGGSPMDCAKGVGARIARPKKTLRQMGGVLKVGKKLPKLYAVPTTSGTGSETTIAAVITDENEHFKYAINDPALIPYAAVLDPLLTLKLPPHITATTGMDALCHAVEAYVGRANTRKTKLNAQQAVLLIRDNLVKAYLHGDDVAARENMQRASYLAGLAFTRAYVGYVHAIAHSLGGKYHIAHGLANAVIMPYVFRAYGTKAHKKLAELADLVGVTEQTDTRAQKAEKFIRWIESLNEQMSIPTGFAEIKEEDLDELVGHAEKEGNPLYPVPKIMGKEELKAIYRQLMK